MRKVEYNHVKLASLEALISVQLGTIDIENALCTPLNHGLYMFLGIGVLFRSNFFTVKAGCSYIWGIVFQISFTEAATKRKVS